MRKINNSTDTKIHEDIKKPCSEGTLHGFLNMFISFYAVRSLIIYDFTLSTIALKAVG